MRTVNIGELKNQLSGYLQHVRNFWEPRPNWDFRPQPRLENHTRGTSSTEVVLSPL
jgi:hypothetical protein